MGKNFKELIKYRMSDKSGKAIEKEESKEDLQLKEEIELEEDLLF